MEKARTQKVHEQPIAQRPIAEGLEEIRAVLGTALANEVLLAGKEATKLTREDFQSPTFPQAGSYVMPERYGQADRYIYTIEYTDGSQVLILGGKFGAGHPEAVVQHAEGEEDGCERLNFICTYDGKRTVTERLPTGEVQQIKVKNRSGRPDRLMRFIRPALGERIHMEHFTKHPS